MSRIRNIGSETAWDAYRRGFPQPVRLCSGMIFYDVLENMIRIFEYEGLLFARFSDGRPDQVARNTPPNVAYLPQKEEYSQWKKLLLPTEGK